MNHNERQALLKQVWAAALEAVEEGAVSLDRVPSLFESAVANYMDSIIDDAFASGRLIDGVGDELGNKRFLELNLEERRTHVAKAAGYSGSDNPDTWANFREAEAWGVPPLRGCLVRMGDKYRRAQNLMRNPANDRVGESLKDTLLDLSNYAKIAVCLWEEEQQARNDSFTDEVKAADALLAVGRNNERAQAFLGQEDDGYVD